MNEKFLKVGKKYLQKIGLPDTWFLWLWQLSIEYAVFKKFYSSLRNIRIYSELTETETLAGKFKNK